MNKIVKVEVKKSTNHFNIIVANNTNEVLQSIRKEELLIFLQLKLQYLGRMLVVEYVYRIDFLNS